MSNKTLLPNLTLNLEDSDLPNQPNSSMPIYNLSLNSNDTSLIIDKPTSQVSNLTPIPNLTLDDSGTNLEKHGELLDKITKKAINLTPIPDLTLNNINSNLEISGLLSERNTSQVNFLTPIPDLTLNNPSSTPEDSSLPSDNPIFNRNKTPIPNLTLNLDDPNVANSCTSNMVSSTSPGSSTVSLGRVQQQNIDLDLSSQYSPLQLQCIQSLQNISSFNPCLTSTPSKEEQQDLIFPSSIPDMQAILEKFNVNCDRLNMVSIDKYKWDTVIGINPSSFHHNTCASTLQNKSPTISQRIKELRRQARHPQKKQHKHFGQRSENEHFLSSLSEKAPNAGK